MRYKLTILLFFICKLGTAQVYQLMPQYGYDAKRFNFDSTLSIPTTCGVPTLKSNVLKKAAIAYDSCNKRFYYYDPKLLAWDTIKAGSGGGGGSTDTTSLSNRINLKLNITDTNVFVRKSDTILFGKNFANTNLTATGDRYHDFVGYDLRIDSTRRFKILGADYDRGYSSQIGTYDGSNEFIIRTERIDNPSFYEQLMFEGYESWKLNSNSESNGNSQINAYGKDIQLGTDSLGSINFKYGVTNSYKFPNTSPSVGNVMGYTAPNTLGWITNNIGIDSLKKSNDSIFFYKNGTWTFSFKDSVGSTSGYVPYVGATQDVDLDTNKISAESVYVTGTNGNGHIHLKHQNGDATASGQSTSLYANNQGYLKWKNDGLYYSTLATPQTADRVFTFQNKSYTIGDSADISAKLNSSDSSIYQTKFRSDTARTNTYTALGLKMNQSDSVTYQTKFRSDTARSNTYTAIASKQDRSISSYSLMANNTNASANMTAQTFRDAGLQTYTGSITWSGTTQPSGTTNHSYQWTQVGKLVTLRISLVYGTAGGGLTQVIMALPSDCPTPQLPNGVSGANAFINFGVGWLLTTNTTMLGTGTFMNACGLRVNSANNGYEIILNRGAGSFNHAHVMINYFAQ